MVSVNGPFETGVWVSARWDGGWRGRAAMGERTVAVLAHGRGVAGALLEGNGGVERRG